MSLPKAVRFKWPSIQELALVGVTMIWGGTFLVVHYAMTQGGPLAFVSLRFSVAAILTALLSFRILRDITRRELLAGLAIGCSIFLGYTLQTYGLQTISSSKSAFITAFYVPLVPLFMWLVLRRPPKLMSWVGIAMAFTGLVLLAGPDSTSGMLGKGELLTTIGSLAFAAEILLISIFAGTVNLIRVTVVQLAVTALLGYLTMPVMGEQFPPFSWGFALCIVAMGMSSALIQLAMNWAQKKVSPTRATLIYAGEPVWAGVVGRIAGERLPALAILGAVLIVLATVVSEIRWPARPSKPYSPIE